MDDSDDEEVRKAKCVRPSPVGVATLQENFQELRTCLFIRQLFPISWDFFRDVWQENYFGTFLAEMLVMICIRQQKSPHDKRHSCLVCYVYVDALCMDIHWFVMEQLC